LSDGNILVRSSLYESIFVTSYVISKLSTPTTNVDIADRAIQVISNKPNSITISYSTFCNAPWANFLHQNIFERLAYFSLKFFAVISKGSSFLEFRK
jgi:hypothetical protein